MLPPVDHEAKLDKIEPGKFCYVENDFRILPGGPLPRDPGDWTVLNHCGRDQRGPPHLLAELIDAVRPGVTGIADRPQAYGTSQQLGTILGLQRGNTEAGVRHGDE